MLTRPGKLSSPLAAELFAKITDRKAVAGVVGLGYVGLPLAATIAAAGFRTIGFDIDPDKPKKIAKGLSYIQSVSSPQLAQLVSSDRLSATADFDGLSNCDVVIICVPTPLNRQREPDLSFIETTSRVITDHLRKGQLVVLESTTYPGTTREVVAPILEGRGLRSGSDFFLGYSPEREDAGNPLYRTANTPKIVAGDGPDASRLVSAFYASFIEKIVEVSSVEVAEASKITENVFRAVNIALVNELKVIYDAMGIDIWEVIEAAKTKPFGYMPFYPGPGLGGHCIPIDPYYLSWKSRQFDIPARFIELAGEINHAMPEYVIARLERALGREAGTTLAGSRVLVLGLAFKKNVSDIRESPALKLIELLETKGAAADYHDPFVPEIPKTREYADLKGRRSSPLDAKTIAAHDAILVATDHDAVDYQLVADHARLIIDSRNVFHRKGIVSSRIVKA